MAGSLRRLRRVAGSAACVEESVRFASRELLNRRQAADYTLRGTPLRTVVRHPMLDMWVLEEIFRGGAYALPPAVTERLDSHGSGPIVVDLGGHVGLFGLFVKKNFPEARITSFEPDPGNAQVLRRCIELNDLAHAWEVVEAAAGTSDREASLVSAFQLSTLGDDPATLTDEHDSLRRIFPFLDRGELLRPNVVRVEVRDVFPALARCDLLKIDIQGGEWDLLEDSRFGELHLEALVVEVHPRAEAGPDPHVYVRERLGAIGMEIAGHHGGHGREWVAWAVRR